MHTKKSLMFFIILTCSFYMLQGDWKDIKQISSVRIAPDVSYINKFTAYTFPSEAIYKELYDDSNWIKKNNRVKDWMEKEFPQYANLDKSEKFRNMSIIKCTYMCFHC